MKFRRLRNVWRYLSDETGSPWMAAIVVVLLLTIVGFTMYVGLETATGISFRPRAR